MIDHCDIGEKVCLPSADAPRIVIIGGGFAGLALAKALKKTKAQVVLVDRHNFHQFQPLLYQVATSGLEPDSIVFPFRKQISDNRNTIFRYATVEQINADQNRVLTDKGVIDYDYLVIATGTKTNFFGLSDIENGGLGMKSIQDALNIRHMMIQNLEQAAITCDEHEKDLLTNFIIVGGGPAGVEMAGALAEFKKYVLPGDYPEYSSEIMDIYLLEAGDQLLASMSDKASEKALEYLTQLGVNVILNEAVAHYDGSMVSTNSGNKLYAKNLIWTAGVTGSFPKGIDKESVVRGNRLRVDHTLRVKGYPNIFAIGDIAAMITEKTPKGYPQVAQVAMQQGKYLGKVIRNKIAGKEPTQPFEYRDKGSLATIGKRRAVADLGKFRFGGYIAWMLWSVVHLFSISGFRNKLMVALNWVWNYFTYDKGNRLIIRDYKKKVMENEGSK
ncbi:MAG: NAD(P)/FAD-dependent oxidoreductase [Owenweeksia sp.]